MPRPQRPWFRFYVEAIHDPKLRRLTPAQRWVWVAVLAMARQSAIPGFLMIADGEPLDAEDIADAAAVRVKDVHAALDAFIRLGMLEKDNTLDALRVAKWSERQYESDDVTKRTRKHRSQERDRNVPTSSPGTSSSRALATETETDTPTGGADAPDPTANGHAKTFTRRLAAVMRSEHGFDLPAKASRHEAYKALLSCALAVLPEDEHHATCMGVVADYVADVGGLTLTREARSHTARLVREFDGPRVLDGFGEAMGWGAGLKPEHEDDPLALSRYVTAVLNGKGKT